ncbi:hypothetical protein HmCmsJML022_04338 [Escherichia coli]|uniref:hypothetical protein n=1 Tax=Escherichia coli TaxID=562 RepID=UPI0010C5B24A|nr:hypothetical protein [Escherichia coli]GCV26262.1 hypothetical protein HmCmsJML022_04338 [Escherichia coli]
MTSVKVWHVRVEISTHESAHPGTHSLFLAKRLYAGYAGTSFPDWLAAALTRTTILQR